MTVLTPEQLADKFRNLHPRVSVGNDSPVWLKPRRTVYGVTLDGKYIGTPRCKTYAGALRKAEQLSARLVAGKPV